MAFEIARTGYGQISPTTARGYPYPNTYHNIGQLQTPYQGKQFGVGGDYGPPQATVYYTPQNPTYPYVMDNEFRSVGYLPTECCGSLPGFRYPGYFRGYNPNYPDTFALPNYFTPTFPKPSTHYTGNPLPPKTITCSPVGPRCQRGSREHFEKLKVAYTPLTGNLL